MDIKNRFQYLAGIKEQEGSSNTNINNIVKDLSDRGTDFKMINTKEKTIDLLDGIVELMDSNFINSPQFSQAVIAFYNKYK